MRLNKNTTDEEWLSNGSKKPFRLFFAVATASFVLFAPPEGLAYTSLSIIRNVWWAMLFANCAVLLIAFAARSLRGEGKRLDSVILFAILAFVPIAVFTMENGGSYIQLLKRAVFIIGPWLYLAVFGEYGFKALLKAMLAGSIIIVVANTASIAIMYSHGSFRPEYADTWLFGQRTYMRNFILPCLFFCLLRDRLKGKKVTVSTIVLFVLSFFSFIVGDAMTSLVVLVVIVACLLVAFRKIKTIPVFRFFIAGAAIVDVLLVHVRALEMFRGIIEGVLNRNMTLSYRTQVWDIVLESIKNNPLSGTGINDLEESGLVVGFGKQLSNAHNQILDVWFKGGVVSVLFFVALIVRCVMPLLKTTHFWAAFVLGVFLGGFCIEAIVSEVWYPQFFLLLYLSAYLYKWAPLFEKDTAS